MDKEQLNSLEYNPKLSKQEKIRGGYDKESIIVDGDQGDNEEIKITEPNDSLEIGDGLLHQNIKEVYDLEEKVKELEKSLYNELKYVKTEVPPEYSDEVKKIKDELGLVSGPLDIDDYMYGLDHLDNPKAALLVELWENFHEDVEGNLKAELFGDVHEINNELKHFKDYIKNFLITKLDTENKLNEDDEDYLSQILQLEKMLGINNRNLFKNKMEVDNLYRNSFIENKENFNDMKEIKYKNESIFQKNKFMNYSIYESNSITEIKLLQLNSLVDDITSSLERETYQDDNEVKRILEVRGESPENSMPYLHKMNLLVKLGVDNDNQEKHKIKNTIRNVFSISNKEKLMNELLVEEEVFQKTALDTIHYINFYDDLYGDSADIFLNQSTKALKKMIQDKKEKTREFFNIEESESYLRELKIKNILEKDDGRQTYQKIKELIK